MSVTRSFQDYGPDERWETDVCIVGAGAGGCAAAAALAEAGLRVILLEEGRRWDPSQFQADSAWAYRNLYAGRGFRTAFGPAPLPVPGGRGVGGSTLINSAICFRPPTAILQDWASVHGCERLGPGHLAPLVERVWRTIGASVNPVEVQGENNLVLKRGAERLGRAGAFMARSAPGCVGCGVCQMGCSSGGKLSIDRTFLVEAQAHGSCDVHAQCRVDSMETTHDRVTALQGRFIDPADLEAKGHFEVRARAFLLSGGAIGSPRLLLGSGLASDAVCGRHLHLHPTTGLLARMPHEIKPWRGVTQGYFVDESARGYLLQTFTTTPDQAYVALAGSLGTEAAEVVKDLRFVAMAGVLLHDHDSVGQVTPRTITYALGDGDRRRLLEGMRACAEVLFAAGAVRVYAGVQGAPSIGSPAEVAPIVNDDVGPHQIILYASHPMGTCRMGTRDDEAVVDPDGRVFGMDNLFVADTSIFPTPLGVNPQVTTMAVGLAIGRAVAEQIA